MTTFETTMNPESERNLDQQLTFLTTSIRKAVEAYEGIRSYGALAKHIDRELQTVGITLTEMHLRAIAIEALRRESEQEENN